MQSKVSLRQHFLKLLREQSQEEVSRKSRLIAGQLWALPAVCQARAILFYASMPGEVDTLAMIRDAFGYGKRVALPIVENKQKAIIPTFISSMEDVHMTPHGIVEPRLDPATEARLEDLDAVIVPGLAFDGRHDRLGRGQGFYDRFLSTLPATTATIGLAFDFQLTERLPVEAHDVRLQHVIAA